jgi:hypothetical protein
VDADCITIKQSRRLFVLIKSVFMCVGLVAALTNVVCAQSTSEKRRDVEKNGAIVMPFSQTDTMHMFASTTSGGKQTVIVKDGNPKQIILVRAHLRKEAAAFARGDFSDPGAIHGKTMPGIAAMHAGYKHLAVTYGEIPSGATITYASSDPTLVSAIHQYFAAQVDEHGAHAMKM